MAKKYPDPVELKDLQLTASGAVVMLEKAIHASSATKKCDKIKTRTNCCVLLGKITKGTLSIGDNITVACNGRKIEDVIAFLEGNKKEPAKSLGEGTLVGICLQNNGVLDIAKQLALN